MEDVEILAKNLKGYNGDAWLVKYGSKYYVVSHTNAYGLNETLVFESSSVGNVHNWLEVAGGKFMSHEDAIEDLRQCVQVI